MSHWHNISRWAYCDGQQVIMAIIVLYVCNCLTRDRLSWMFTASKECVVSTKTRVLHQNKGYVMPRDTLNQRVCVVYLVTTEAHRNQECHTQRISGRQHAKQKFADSAIHTPHVMVWPYTTCSSSYATRVLCVLSSRSYMYICTWHAALWYVWYKCTWL